jgi:hypothetical protein
LIKNITKGENEMNILEPILKSPIANLLIIAGLAFLGIAVVGDISGKIQPGTGGRLLSGLLGFCLLGGGLVMYGSTPLGIDSQATPTLPSPSNTFSTPVPPDVQIGITSPTFTPSPFPSGFRLVEVFLRADPFDYVGVCPVMITFSGRISVAGGAGMVAYKWIRNDGASAPVETLTFSGPGSQDISTTWYLGDVGMNYSGWQAIEILDPQALTSDRAEFRIQCQ